MSKGTLVKVSPNGTIEHVRVENPQGWTIDQLYHLIGCEVVERIAVRYDQHTRVAYVDEEAKLQKHGKPLPPVNTKATEWFRDYHGPTAKPLLGVVVLWIPDETSGVGRRGVISTRRKKAKDGDEPINRF